MVATENAPIAIYLEIGRTKTFAGALDWPGWCRGGRDEAAAVVALVDYAPRYAALFPETHRVFTPPGDRHAVTVTERLAGTSATDFGAPDRVPAQDAQPFDEAERVRSETILEAIWRAFDRAVDTAEGRELRTGPRGGGRSRDNIVRHILGADAVYLRRLGQRFSHDDDAPLGHELMRTRAAIRAGLIAVARGAIPEKGPRGSTIWTPRYYVRRVAWHTLDHAWEMEDRLL